MSLGERLTAARKASGLSQEKVGSIVGKERATVSLWENDGAEPGVEKIIQLAALYKVSLLWLMTGKEPMTSDEHPVPTIEDKLADNTLNIAIFEVIQELTPKLDKDTKKHLLYTLLEIDKRAKK